MSQGSRAPGQSRGTRLVILYTRKSNPCHGFLNGLTQSVYTVQCVPALSISPLKNSTAIHLKDLHYYLYAWWLKSSFLSALS